MSHVLPNYCGQCCWNIGFSLFYMLNGSNNFIWLLLLRVILKYGDRGFLKHGVYENLYFITNSNKVILTTARKTHYNKYEKISSVTKLSIRQAVSRVIFCVYHMKQIQCTQTLYCTQTLLKPEYKCQNLRLHVNEILTTCLIGIYQMKITLDIAMHLCWQLWIV